MIKNYFKIGFRNLLKNKLSTFINLGGLALAVGCCLVVYVFINWSMNLDCFHSKLDKLFVVEKVSDENGDKQYWGNSPAELGPLLKEDFPAIKNMARVNYAGVVFKQGENVFRESVSFVDDSFYDMFDFPVKWGSTAAKDQHGIVLTHELSEKLFGKENSLGKSLNIIFDSNGQKTIENFTVSAVLDKRPIETSFYFSALISYKKMASLGLAKSGNWAQSADITFLEADNEAALVQIKNHKRYLNLYNTANQNNKISGYHFQPLKSMNFHAYKVKNVSFNASKPAGMIMLFVIGISILLLVYFNYMNIAIASASTRLKEIGVRKVMGSNRKQLIFQFIIEHLVLCSIAVFIGALLAKFLFLPWFGTIANIELGLKLFTNYQTWLALIVLTLVSALSGAAYPAFFISAFKPVNIIKENLKIGINNRFRKALLGFQFFLTILAISTALAFNQENQKLKEKPWGYNPANNLVVKLNGTSSFEVLKAELKNRQAIQSVSGSVQSLGNYSKQALIKLEGKVQTVQSLNVLPGFVSQLGINITKGRDLNADLETDLTSSVVVNQAFLKQMKLNSGVGRVIEYENHNYTIVGEVNNFQYENFGSPVGPMVIMACKAEDVNFAYIKTTSNSLTDIQKIWQKINPNAPFDYYYQDTVFDGFFNDFKGVSKVLNASCLILIVISMSGVFGLATLILSKKMKDISVRKVLGANILNVSFLINKEFLTAIIFAGLLGLPLSYWIINTLFKQISPESSTSFLLLIMSFIVLCLITFMSVAWHILKAYTSKPITYLKNE